MAEPQQTQQDSLLGAFIGKMNSFILDNDKRIAAQDKEIKKLREVVDKLVNESKRDKMAISKLDEKLRYTKEKLTTVESNLRMVANKR